MKNVLLTGLAALSLTACVKQSDFEDFQSDAYDTQIRQDNQITQLQEALLETTIQLQTAIDTNSDGVTSNAEGINAANVAIAENLTLIGQVSTTLTTEVANIYGELEATELELISLLGEAVEDLKVAIAAGDLAQTEELNATAALLREEIAIAQAAAQAYADVNDNDTIFNATNILESIATVSTTLSDAVNAQVEVDANQNIAIDALTAVSASYDGVTGILTITYADNSTYSTEDLRGEQGIRGIQGIQGIPGANGNDGATGSQGTAGSNGSNGVTPTIDIATTDTASGTLVTVTINGVDTTFEVLNGVDGNDGADGADGADGQDANGNGGNNASAGVTDSADGNYFVFTFSGINPGTDGYVRIHSGGATTPIEGANTSDANGNVSFEYAKLDAAFVAGIDPNNINFILGYYDVNGDYQEMNFGPYSL